MLLGSLYDLVKTLSRRIDEHGAALRRNETRTRSVLIDPLLCELGWDTEDPTMVVLEYRLSAGGTADYALLNDGKPVVIVEAKKLGIPLRNAITQATNYCMQNGIDYFAVTDGRQWEIYETYRRGSGSWDKNLVTQFDIKDSSAETCLKALALWRPSVQEGRVSVGHTPIVDVITPEVQPTSTPVDPSIPTPVVTPTPVHTPTPTPNPEPVLDTEGLMPITEIKYEKGSKPPVEIVFPDQDRADIGNWADLGEEVIRWLFSKGHLDPSHCPIQGSSKSYYMLNTTPTHPTERKFRQHRYIEGMYYNSSYLTYYAHVRNALYLFKHVGLDPAEFKVRF